MSARARDPFSCFVLQRGRAAAPVPVPAACSSPSSSLIPPARVPRSPMGPQPCLHAFELLCLLSTAEPLVPPASLAPAPFQAALSLGGSLHVPLTAAGRRPFILFIAGVQSRAAGWEARSWAVSRSEDRLPAEGPSSPAAPGWRRGALGAAAACFPLGGWGLEAAADHASFPGRGWHREWVGGGVGIARHPHVGWQPGGCC